MAQDRTVASTRRRIVNLLTKVPTGVPRSNLHAIAGETTLIHAALDELIAEGEVVELINRRVRGKPRRTYILQSNYEKYGLASEYEAQSEPIDTLVPGATNIVLQTVQEYPGLTRSELWSRATNAKSWAARALDELVAAGKIKESFREDQRGGLTRVYTPVEDADKSPQREAELGDRVAV